MIQGVVHLELYKKLPDSEDVTSLNQYLIKHGFAQHAEESYLSKVLLTVIKQISSLINFFYLGKS